MVVVYGCNRDWYKYLEVNIYALLKYNHTVEKIYILCEDNNMNNFNYLKKIKSTYNVDFIIYNITDLIYKYFNGKYNSNLIYTDFAYSKLLISEVVKDDKVLYLDVDTIVKDDISKLWNYNIQGYYAAGVKDNGGFENGHNKKIGAVGKYVNTGVLLLNCELIRRDRLVEKFFNIINSRNLRYPDQDAFNIVCGNRIIYVPSMFNNAFNELFDVTKYVKNPKLRFIYHYTGDKTNWVADKYFAEEWYFEYFEMLKRYKDNYINRIRVAFSSNRNLYKYLAFNVYNLLKYNKGVETLYLIIEDDDISSIPNLEDVLNLFDVDVKIINFSKVKYNYLTFDCSNLNSSFSDFCFGKLLLSEFTGEDKIIYLDMDTVVKKDISILFNMEIDDVYALGVKDYGVLDDNNHYGSLNISTKYINTGVMVLNLKKIREDNLVDKLFNYINNNKLKYPDQDAFNIICNDKVRYIPSIFNCCNFVTKEVLNYDNIYIFHYPGYKHNWIIDHYYSEDYYVEFYDFLKKFNIDYSEI